MPIIFRNFVRALGITGCCLVGCSCFYLQVYASRFSEPELVEIESNAEMLESEWTSQSVQKATKLFQLASTEWESYKDYSRSAKCLRRIVKLKLMVSEEKAALPLLDKALFLETKLKNTEGEAETHSLYTLVLLSIGKNTESGEHYQKALQLANQSNSPKQIAIALAASGLYYYAQRDFGSMLLQQEKALRIFEEIEDEKSRSELLVDIAFSHTINNDRQRGRDAALEAVRLAKERNDVRIQSLGLIALGDAYQRMGEAELSFDSLQLAKNLFVSDLDFFNKGVLYNRLGHYYNNFHDLNEAKRYFIISYSLFERANNVEGTAETLTELGRISTKLGNYEEGSEYFRKSLKIAYSVGDELPIALANQSLGEVNLRLNKLKEAESYLMKSLRFYETIRMRYHISEIKQLIGLIYEKKEDLRKAEFLYREAHELNEKLMSKFASAQTFFALSRLKLKQNDINLALSYLEMAIRLSDSSKDDTANSKLKRSFSSSVYNRYELYSFLSMQKYKESKQQAFAIKALQGSERFRSQSFIETLQLSNANLIKDADLVMVKREKELRELLNLEANHLTDLLSVKDNPEEAQKIEDRIDVLQNDLESIKAELKQQSPIYSAIKNPPPFDVAEFQRNVLDDKTLLLEYSFGEKESYLWVVSKDEVSSVVLPSREVLEKRIDVLRNAIEERQKLSVDDPDAYLQKLGELESVFNSEAKLLSNDLLGQVADKLDGKRLIVVPDGKLALLPLSALPFPNSDEPMIAKNEIVYEPSASLLNILPNLQTRKQLPTKDLLVFADPVFSKIDSRLTSKTETESSVPSVAGLFDLNLRDFRILDADRNIPRLPASQNEADSISKTLGGNRTTIASGFDANRERVLNSDIGDYRMLHFATHGLIDMNRPEISSIVLSQLDEAGNKREGFLRLQDIYAMDLATDLVVLSACQSGIGKEIRGEGLMSLNNAFLQAGAKSVVSSAWKVDDNATAELMSKFYSNLIDKGFTTSEALRQAQIEMSKSTQFKSPFYWAAFTVQGEFRQPIKVSTNYFAYVLFGLFGIVGFWIIWRFRKTKGY